MDTSSQASSSLYCFLTLPNARNASWLFPHKTVQCPEKKENNREELHQNYFPVEQDEPTTPIIAARI